jgi:hypothetical protein
MAEIWEVCILTPQDITLASNQQFAVLTHTNFISHNIDSSLREEFFGYSIKGKRVSLYGVILSKLLADGWEPFSGGVSHILFRRRQQA